MGTAYAAPTVTTTTPPTSIGSTTATIAGNITNLGTPTASSSYGFVYSTTANTTTALVLPASGTVTAVEVGTTGATTGPYSASLTGLTANTTYYYRAYATNATGTGYGSTIESFTTTAANAPTITTGDIAPATTAAGNDVTVSFATTGTFDAANAFTAVLSNAAGSFASGTTTLATTSATATSLTVTIPVATAAGSAYLIRVNGSSPATTGSNSTNTLTVTVPLVAPTVTTTAATAITFNSASSGGNVTADGGATITARGVVYGTSASPRLGGPGTTQVADGSPGTGTFTSSLTGLSGSTAYYVAAYATNSVGTTYGADRTFTTLAPAAAPTVTTTAATAITFNSASSGGNVTADGGATITARGVVYGTSASPQIGGSGVTQVTASGTTGAFTSALTGLSASTIYYVAAYATNSAGTTYGADQTFTTAVAPLLGYTFPTTNPTLPTTQATSVTGSAFSRATGLTVEQNTPDFRSSNFPTSTASPAAGSTTGYHQFTFTVATGSTANLTSLVVSDRSSSTGPTRWEVRTSLDGYTATVGSVQTNPTTTLTPRTVSLTGTPALANVMGTVTFRIYAYGGSAAAGTFGVDDVSLYGTIGASAPIATEPTTQPTLSTANATFSQADVTVSGGDGTKQLVVMHATTAAAVAPADGNTYAASTTFGSGAITGAGNYVVYAGATGTAPTTFTVTGLAANTGYTLETYAYNDNATAGLENYLTTAPGTATLTTTAQPAVFYAKATGDLSQPSTFAAQADGTGGSPGNFTSANTTYNVTGTGRTIGANWTVSGTNSKVVLAANSSLLIPTGFVFSGKLDQLANSTLIIQNTTAAAYTSIQQGVQDASSTIDFAQAGSYTVPASSATFAFQNLKLTNGTKTLAKNGGTISAPITSTVVPGNITLDNTVLSGSSSTPFSSVDLSGNLTLVNGATFSSASAGKITLNLLANSPQTFTGNGSDIILFRLSALTAGGGASLSDVGGTTNLELGNAAAGGYYLETGTTLALNANALRFTSGGKAVIYTGATASQGLGTVTPTAASSFNFETTSNSYIGTLRLTSGATTVNNLRFSASNDYLTVPSDLTVNGVLTLANGELRVGSSTTPATLALNGTVVNSGTGSITGSAATNLVVGGTGALGTLVFTAGSAEVKNFTLDRANGTLALGSPLTVDNTLTLTKGIITTSSTNLLTLAAAGTIVASPANTFNPLSFVNGPLARQTPAVGATPTDFMFPVGKSAVYRPLTLSVTNQAATTYTAEAQEGAPVASALPAGVARVSAIRSYLLTPNVQPVTVTSTFQAFLTIPFGPSDYVNDPASLVMVKRPNSTTAWENIGNSATTGISTVGPGDDKRSVAGTLTSAAFSSFSEFTLAAANPDATINPLSAAFGTPLPVELTAFVAQRQADKTVALKWNTASEKNSARFEVQRSLNGREFATIATVAAQGSSSHATAYAAPDKAAPAAKLYYRLRQVDLDGTASFSPVATVAGSGEAAKVALYPNPAHARIGFIAETATAYRVLNQLGQPLLRGTTEAGPTSIGLETLPTGLYFLELQTAAGRTVQKFEKE